MSRRRRAAIQDPYAERESEKYAQPIPSREAILSFIKRKKMPHDLAALYRGLKLSLPGDEVALGRRVRAMLRDGQLMRLKDGLYWPSEAMHLVSGRVMRDKGKGVWVVPEDGSERITLLLQDTHEKIYTGYRVEVAVPAFRTTEIRQGRLESVLESVAVRTTGRFVNDAGMMYVIPHGKQIESDVFIPSKDAKKARDGQIVLIEVTGHATRHAQPVGRVITILGTEKTKGIEIDACLHAYDLPHAWSKTAQKEAKRIRPNLTPKDKRDRTDLSHLPFITIDGEDARDFDDAVYCQPKPRGGWTLWVAIADVSHYVMPGSGLDQDAYERGTSVYFPGTVVPMLPEKLSNDLCSLKPEVERLVLACELQISATGQLRSYDFCNAVIRSHARMTYTKVAAFLANEQGLVQKHYADLKAPIHDLKNVYEALLSQRMQRDAIDFDTVETKLIFNRQGKIAAIEPTHRNIAHRMIEECMLCANVAAAKFLKKHKLPGLYRVHAGPSEEKLTELRPFLAYLNLPFPKKGVPTPKDYTRVIKDIAHQPEAHVVQMMLLRSLQQAVYSPNNMGHFGLAYSAYAHFTSPIRRYPDLHVHRLIKAVLSGRAVDAKRALKLGPDAAGQMGEHLSHTERRADEATREVEKWLKCQYMEQHIGETFEAVISGITHFGFFAEITDLYVEGLVHVTSLHGDYYHFDPLAYTLSGERSGVTYGLGERVTIQVARVDLDARKIDFALVYDTPKRVKQKRQTRQKSTRRRQAKKQRATTKTKRQ